MSVLPAETVAALAVVPEGTYVDCTLGGAGHAGRIAAQLSPAGRLIGIDQDETAIAAAQVRLASAACRVSLVHDNFRNLTAILTAEGVSAVDGILFDLGVSSPQIDTAARGFSYMQDAPLDMRMDRRAVRSAHTVVNEYSAARLTEIFYTYGEERWAKRIAAFIEAARKERPIETTAHALKPSGRLAVITFHSLEDRIVKRTMQQLARGCICPPHTPVCICGHTPELRLIGKAQTASLAECAANARAKSAKLRVAEKL